MLLVADVAERMFCILAQIFRKNTLIRSQSALPGRAADARSIRAEKLAEKLKLSKRKGSAGGFIRP